ncbi:MAG: pentapeptide repeat-containing protein [Calothrix sp. FI2-JRJ7]|jgi:uncharacterized protein YjbI with pentapeptide repeats/DNA-binding XRE family transcriptional regulator|nr:pentapeptide repeat-containing protein [Calothrix sp. FI2-JRJ7]
MERSCRLSEEGCEKAKTAIKKKGWKQQELADFAGCSRQTVVNFYNRKPIDKGYSKQICDVLELTFEDVVELEVEKTATKNNIYAQQESANKTDIKLVNDETGGVITTLPKINGSEANKNTSKQESKAVIVLSGRLLLGALIELNGQKYDVEEVLKQLNKQQGFDLKSIDIQEGSIKIIVSDSPENIDRLNVLFKSRNLVEVLGIPIEKVELLNNNIEKIYIEDKKLQLIEKIIAGEVSGDDLVGTDLSYAFLYKVDLLGINLQKANLAGADLSEAELYEANLELANLELANLVGANLQGANLQGANLQGANLQRANLQGANLQRANLGLAKLILPNSETVRVQIANLKGANLQGANLQEAGLVFAKLQGANLERANLEGANLEDASVEDALFSNSSGITPEMQKDLERRGAIFGDKSFAKV